MPKRPGMNEIANAVSRIGRTVEPPADVPVSPPPAPAESSSTTRVEAETYWQKATFPLRVEQLATLKNLLAQWMVDRRVRVSEAEVVRLALDHILETMRDDPDALLVALYEQEQRERERVPSRKFGRSQGLEHYLKQRGLI